MEAALGVIAVYDPSALDRMHRLFTGILVIGTEPFRRAHWDPDARLCIVTEWYVQSSQEAELIAKTLVHESMHARLDQLGVRYMEGRRAAIEVLCAMAELAFARRITPESALVVATEQRIDEWSTGGEARWSDKTNLGNSLGHLKELGTPKWLVRVVGRIARFVRERAA